MHVCGYDELGVLLMGHDFHSWWCGTILDIDEARRLVPGQNATTLQDLSGAFSSLNGPAISSAGTAITSYLQSSCGAVSSSST